MSLKVNNRIRDQLSWPVKRRLPSSQRFVELRLTIGAEVFLLRGEDAADLATAAGVDWVELSGDYYRGGRGAAAGGGFVREEAGDEEVLDLGRVGVGDDAGEAEMAEDHGGTVWTRRDVRWERERRAERMKCGRVVMMRGG